LTGLGTATTLDREPRGVHARGRTGSGAPPAHRSRARQQRRLSCPL